MSLLHSVCFDWLFIVTTSDGDAWIHRIFVAVGDTKSKLTVYYFINIALSLYFLNFEPVYK